MFLADRKNRWALEKPMLEGKVQRQLENPGTMDEHIRIRKHGQPYRNQILSELYEAMMLDMGESLGRGFYLRKKQQSLLVCRLFRHLLGN